MTDNVLKSQAFKLKGRLYTVTVLQLLNPDASILNQELTDVVTKAPRMFENMPVVLDCSSVANEVLNVQLLCRVIREAGLIPVGVQGGSAVQNVLAQSYGLAVFNASADKDKPLEEQKIVKSSPSKEVASAHNKLITTPVRSGQQVVNKAGDLVIAASVSRGAELLAGGNIHVYGTLRGRALAGITGDKSVRIFCQSLEAELVSIAGIYRLSDAFERMNSPCQIFIQNDRIQIEAV